MAVIAVLFLIYAVQLQSALGQTLAPDGTCPSGAQPVVTRLTPPAGTTGNFPEDSSNYTITGAMLDQIDTISVQANLGGNTVNLRAIDIVMSSSLVMFHIEDARLREGEVVNATIMFSPRDPDCAALTFDTKLHARCESWGRRGAGLGSLLRWGGGGADCVQKQFKCGWSFCSAELILALWGSRCSVVFLVN